MQKGKLHWGDDLCMHSAFLLNGKVTCKTSADFCCFMGVLRRVQQYYVTSFLLVGIMFIYWLLVLDNIFESSGNLKTCRTYESLV